MKKIIALLVFVSLFSFLYAGNEKLVILGMVDRFEQEYDSVTIDYIDFEAWLSSNPNTIFTKDSIGNSAEIYENVRGVCIIDLSNFPAWEVGDTLCVKIKDYNVSKDIVCYSNYFEDVISDSTSDDQYFGFEDYGIVDSGDPLIINYPVYDNAIGEDFKPEEFSLFQNYPNPFNPVTQIKFALPASGNVEISVYNSNGQLISELVNEVVNAGMHSVNFDASNLNSGMYYYMLKTENSKISKKMLILK